LPVSQVDFEAFERFPLRSTRDGKTFGQIRTRELRISARLQNALAALADAMREVNAAIEEMRGEHDPLALHIFVSRGRFKLLEIVC